MNTRRPSFAWGSLFRIVLGSIIVNVFLVALPVVGLITSPNSNAPASSLSASVHWNTSSSLLVTHRFWDRGSADADGVAYTISDLPRHADLPLSLLFNGPANSFVVQSQFGWPFRCAQAVITIPHTAHDIGWRFKRYTMARDAFGLIIPGQILPLELCADIVIVALLVAGMRSAGKRLLLPERNRL